MLDLLPKGKLKIIVAPLNWGLGHASRSLAITDKLLDYGHEVIFASDGESLDLIHKNFPGKASYELPGYGLKYRYSNELYSLIDNLPGIIKAIKDEKQQAEKICSELNPDVIISDSRFGFRSRSCLSVLVTHQLNLKTKYIITRWLGNSVNRYWINKFDQCWIPDRADNILSGHLTKSHGFSHTKFIGPISTFKKIEQEKDIDLLIVLSGPEPARTRFEARLINHYIDYRDRVVLVRGTKSGQTITIPRQWEIHDMLDRTELNNLVCRANHIVGRSGYSSIMDYYSIDRGACLVPTPGQAEQEYLARHLDGKYGFFRKLESDFK